MKPIFIDETGKIFFNENAKAKLEEKNDLIFLTSRGITEVNASRWTEAQRYEYGTWMSEKGLEERDDRNKFHERNFGNYSVIKGLNFGNAIEIGCGPFTNMARVLYYANIEKVTLLDPLINDYLNHPNCTYKNSIIRYKKGYLHHTIGKKCVSIIAESIEDFSDNEKFDLIILINVLEHCFSLKKVFDKILSLSSRKGVLIFHDKLIPKRDLAEIASKIYDSGHPLRVPEEEILKFLYDNYEYLFEKRIEIPVKDIYKFDSIYFIGKLFE